MNNKNNTLKDTLLEKKQNRKKYWELINQLVQKYVNFFFLLYFYTFWYCMPTFIILLRSNNQLRWNIIIKKYTDDLSS